MRQPLNRARAGFTLLELLIAITIFAVIGAMALGGYNQLLKQRERADTSMARIRALQLAVTRIAQDFEQLEPRPVRDPTAQIQRAALMIDTSGIYGVEFTHAGWSNPAGVQRPTLQRVAYRLQDGKLYRDYWTVLDRTLNSMPVEVTLIDKVSSFKLRFMDQNRQWQTTWPVAGAGANAARSLPTAVEFTLQLEDWGEIKRVVEVL
jgi:general secretion pathway protein J